MAFDLIGTVLGSVLVFFMHPALNPIAGMVSVCYCGMWIFLSRIFTVDEIILQCFA